MHSIFLVLHCTHERSLEYFKEFILFLWVYLILQYPTSKHFDKVGEYQTECVLCLIKMCTPPTHKKVLSQPKLISTFLSTDTHGILWTLPILIPWISMDYLSLHWLQPNKYRPTLTTLSITQARWLLQTSFPLLHWLFLSYRQQMVYFVR